MTTFKIQVGDYINTHSLNRAQYKTIELALHIMGIRCTSSSMTCDSSDKDKSKYGIVFSEDFSHNLTYSLNKDAEYVAGQATKAKGREILPINVFEAIPKSDNFALDIQNTSLINLYNSLT